MSHFGPRRRKHISEQSSLLALEPLELRLLLSVNPVGTNPLVSAPLPVTVPIVLGSTSTPSSSQNVLSSAEIRERSVAVSVVSSTGDSSACRYEWQVVETPTDGTVSFAKNATNAAKMNTLTFSRAGTYVVRVSVQNAGSVLSSDTLQFNVVQTFTSIRVKTADARTVTAVGLIVSDTSQQLSAIALDQFGAPLTVQPVIAWQIVKLPIGSTPALVTDGNSVTANFNRAGAYVLRAQSGLLRFDVPINVAQTLSSFTLTTSDNVAVDSDQTLTVTTTSLRLNFKAFDQFTNPITSLPKIAWATTLAPPESRSVATLSGGVLSVTFSRLGTYTTEALIAGQTFRFFSNVVPTLSSISVRTPENRAVTTTSPVVVTGTSQRLAALALDQFGIALEVQPNISWQSVAFPSGATATLTPDGNGILVQVNRAGKYTLRAQAGAIAFNMSLNVTQTLASLNLLKPDGSAVNPDEPVTVASASQRLTVRGLDQFNNAMATLPRILFTTTAAPAGGSASIQLSSGTATVSFAKIGSYSISAQSETIHCAAAFVVVPALNSVVAIGTDNRVLKTASTITVSGTSALLTAKGLDQFGQLLLEQPTFIWAVMTNPAGGQATLNSSGNDATFTFNKAGTYTVNATSGKLVLNLKLTVGQVAASLKLTPGSLAITFGTPRQILAQTVDQFGLPLSTQPAVTWTATGGTISTKGLFTTGNQAGSFSIGARTATMTATASVEVTAPAAPTGLTDPALADLVNTFYADQKIDRAEMMEILRSAGTDGTVNATELTDVRFLVSATTPFSIPAYVRELASDVVGSNPANRMFQGKTAGNLSAGSSATLLNNLVDKWFLGADEPQIGTAGLTYQTTIGNLFNGTPSRGDARQGQLGDCYFIAAVSAIADRNANAVRDLFIDNGDGTYTVRFYYGVGAGTSKVDYVTVNRRLPAYANGTLGFSGYGQSISSTATTVWIALAEKAYAQWNETGNEGRDGTNRYSAIEGGWMSDVNAPVLGYNSTINSFSSSSKQTLLTALTAQQAVTAGTLSNASTGGLYGSHAYIVTGYNSSTDTFTLHNPWGVSHPAPLTWTQLQANCSSFVMTTTTGLTSANLPNTASLPGTNQTAPIADRTQSIPIPRTSQIQSVRLTQWASDDVLDSEPVVSLVSDSVDSPDLDTLVQNTRAMESAIATIRRQAVLNPVSVSTELAAELLDLAFLDFDLNAL